MQSLTHDLEDFVDMATMQFVDPYEVNPIINTTFQMANVPQQVSVNPEFIILQNGNIAQNKLKMEEFGDLSALLSAAVSNVDTTGSTDELSTPVFDKDVFDFTPSTSAKSDENKTDLKVKVEYNSQYYFCDKNIYTDLNLAVDNQLQNKGNSYSISKVGSDSTDMYLYQQYACPLTYKENLNDARSPPNQSVNFIAKMTDFNGISFCSNLRTNNSNNNNNDDINNSYSTATSPQDDRYSYISSPADDQQIDVLVPEHCDHSYDARPKLNLMTEPFQSSIKKEDSSTLNTPDVIEDVVNMGNDFNILDLVNNEDITIISADEELLSSLSSPTAIPSEPSTPSIRLSTPSPVKRFSRRKLSDDDDDDEDYVPPRKKQSTVTLADIDIENSNSSDISDYHAEKASRKSYDRPRGRPPKRGYSVSSDVSKDPDASKYRELRDKNNEASRRSRLKRKMKEEKYEKEADDLYNKNIRLKAQVEELEKMVSTFRNNLFKILVTK